MRRILWALPVLLPLPLACFSPGAPLTVTLDAGVLPQIDFADATASLPDVVLPEAAAQPLAPETGIPEAGPPEAAPPEASTEAASPPPPVTVTVFYDGSGEQGASVVYYDPATGSVTGPLMTDASGTLQLTNFPAGSTLTVAMTHTEQPTHLVSYVAVQPGDAIQVIDPVAAPAQIDVLTPPSIQGGEYIYVGPCSTYDTSTLSVGTGCTLNGSFPVLGVYNSQYFFGKGFSTEVVDASDSLTVPLANAQVYSGFGQDDVSAIHIPSASSFWMGYSEVASGIPLAAVEMWYGTNGSESYTFQTHPGYPDFVQTEVGAAPSYCGTPKPQPFAALARRTVPPVVSLPDAGPAEGGGPLPAPQEIYDLSTLPKGLLGQYANLNGSNVTMAWATSAPPTSYAGTLVTLADYAGDTWVIVVPPGVTGLVAPGASLSFTATSWNISVLSGTAIPDYASLQKASPSMAATIGMRGYPSSQNGQHPPAVPPLPADGELDVVGYDYNYLNFGQCGG
jgi:hypothetical protein